MFFTISAVLIFGLMTVEAVRSQYCSGTVASVCFLFGFFFAKTQFDIFVLGILEALASIFKLLG